MIMREKNQTMADSFATPSRTSLQDFTAVSESASDFFAVGLVVDIHRAT